MVLMMQWKGILIPIGKRVFVIQMIALNMFLPNPVMLVIHVPKVVMVLWY
jgi:hypothetical protein